MPTFLLEQSHLSKQAPKTSDYSYAISRSLYSLPSFSRLRLRFVLSLSLRRSPLLDLVLDRLLRIGLRERYRLSLDRSRSRCRERERSRPPRSFSLSPPPPPGT